jgi:methanethiol S-methyltransferase
MNSEHIFLALFWFLYCVTHSLLADPGWKENMQSFLGKGFRFYRLAYTIFAFLGLAGIVIYQYQLNSPLLFQSSSIMKWVGWIFFLGGISIMIICIKKYFLSLSGLRNLVRESAPSGLMISGLHRYVRHPLYLGTFITIWSGFLLLPLLSILISNAIITVYTIIGIQLEEKKLILEYGDDYRQYMQRVPRLIPFGFKRKSSPELP